MLQTKLQKQQKQIDNLNKKIADEQKPKLVPRKYRKYLDYIYQNYYYLRLKSWIKANKFFIPKIATVAVWSLFILAGLHLFDIVKFTAIHYAESAALYFVIMEIAEYIKEIFYAKKN